MLCVKTVLILWIDRFREDGGCSQIKVSVRIAFEF